MTSDRPAELTAAEIFAAKKWCFCPAGGLYADLFSSTLGRLRSPPRGYQGKRGRHHCVFVGKRCGAWGEAQNVKKNILMLADGSGAFTEAVGLELDLTARHMGIRSQRYAMMACLLI